MHWRAHFVVQYFLMTQNVLQIEPELHTAIRMGKQWLPAALTASVRTVVLPVTNCTAANWNDILYNADDLYAEVLCI